MEKYEIANGKLIILDDELQINLECDFNLPSIKKDSVNLFTKKYENGAMKRTSMMKGESLHGETLFFNIEGGVEGRCYYFEDKLHGPSIFFHEEKITSESWFYFGGRQGKARRFYTSGELYSLERYRDNLLHGEQKYFYPNKNLKSFLVYEKGHLLKAELYFEDGSLKRSVDTDRKIDKIQVRD